MYSENFNFASSGQLDHQEETIHHQEYQIIDDNNDVMYDETVQQYQEQDWHTGEDYEQYVNSDGSPSDSSNTEPQEQTQFLEEWFTGPMDAPMAGQSSTLSTLSTPESFSPTAPTNCSQWDANCEQNVNPDGSPSGSSTQEQAEFYAEWFTGPMDAPMAGQSTISTPEVQAALIVEMVPAVKLPLPEQSLVPSAKLITEQWNHFRQCGEPEQLANNAGRNLFPSLRFSVEGLNPNGTYKAALKLIRISNECQYLKKYNKWTENGRLHPPALPGCTNEVHTRKSSGAQLMQDGIDLSWVKIYTIGVKTRNKELKPHMLRVYSQHRYMPRLTVLQQTADFQFHVVFETSFEQATFIAVSKVKNPGIGQLRRNESMYSRYKTPQQ